MKIYVVTEASDGQEIFGQEIFTKLSEAKKAITKTVRNFGFTCDMEKNLEFIKNYKNESNDHILFQLDGGSTVHLKVFKL